MSFHEVIEGKLWERVYKSENGKIIVPHMPFPTFLINMNDCKLVVKNVDSQLVEVIIDFSQSIFSEEGYISTSEENLYWHFKKPEETWFIEINSRKYGEMYFRAI